MKFINKILFEVLKIEKFELKYLVAKSLSEGIKTSYHIKFLNVKFRTFYEYSLFINYVCMTHSHKPKLFNNDLTIR